MLNKMRTAVILVTCLVLLQMSPVMFAQDQLADFALRSVDGQTVTASSMRGKVSVLAFGASWLPLTRNQMEALKKLADQYTGKGVAFYWVSTESDNPKSKNYAPDEQLRDLSRRYKVAVLRDCDGVMAKRLGVDQLPSIVIINKQGNIADRTGGMDPESDLTKQVSERLNKIGG
jgi:peroxiredoxin